MSVSACSTNSESHSISSRCIQPIKQCTRSKTVYRSYACLTRRFGQLFSDINHAVWIAIREKSFSHRNLKLAASRLKFINSLHEIKSINRLLLFSDQILFETVAQQTCKFKTTQLEFHHFTLWCSLMAKCDLSLNVAFQDYYCTSEDNLSKLLPPVFMHS